MQPIKGKCYITQKYGRTEFAQSPIGLKAYKSFGGIHPGIDFGCGGINAECVSLVTGTVVRASMDGGWGNHVEVQRADGWRVQYAHLQSMVVKVGDKVNKGDVLGRVGSTGSSTGTHLHLGLRKSKLIGGWEYKDPTFLLDTDPESPVLPTSKLVKPRGGTAIYVWNGQKLFQVPDISTLNFLFKGEPVEEVEMDILSKLPHGQMIPSMGTTDQWNYTKTL